jgi:hypothetical protein
MLRHEPGDLQALKQTLQFNPHAWQVHRAHKLSFQGIRVPATDLPVRVDCHVSDDTCPLHILINCLSPVWDVPDYQTLHMASIRYTLGYHPEQPCKHGYLTTKPHASHTASGEHFSESQGSKFRRPKSNKTQYVYVIPADQLKSVYRASHRNN